MGQGAGRALLRKASERIRKDAWFGSQGENLIPNPSSATGQSGNLRGFRISLRLSYGYTYPITILGTGGYWKVEMTKHT